MNDNIGVDTTPSELHSTFILLNPQIISDSIKSDDSLVSIPITTLFTLLNVNFPKVEDEAGIKGIKICRQCKAKWQENFDERKDPGGRSYYWLTGKFINGDHGEDTDEWALANNYISVVPTQFDLTAYHAIPYLNDWEF